MEPILISIAVAVILFVVLREAVTWYFKINDSTRTLHRIEIQLKRMNNDPLNENDLRYLSTDELSTLDSNQLTSTAKEHLDRLAIS